MFNIRIVCLGALKEEHWQRAAAEYLKRLKPYARITVIEIPEEPFRSADEREKVQAKEAAKIKKYLTGTVIALDEHGKELTSTAFSSSLECESQSGDLLTFIIGGPLGLHPSILETASHRVSLSSLTFPHQMVRVILLEQLYRSVTIAKGKAYHY